MRKRIIRHSKFTVIGFALLLAACNPVDFRLANPVENPALPIAEEAPSSPAPVNAPVITPVLPQTPTAEVTRAETPVVASPPPESRAEPVVVAPPVPVVATPHAPPAKASTNVPILVAPPAPVVLVPPIAKVSQPEASPKMRKPKPVQFTQRPPDEGPRAISGDCATRSQLLSCMHCPVPSAQDSAPRLSRKGQALLDILTKACLVKNASDPGNYEAPDREELLSRMNQLSPRLYPDTTMSAIQTSTVNALLTSQDELQKTFGGIFHSGVTRPTRAFETYFGLSTIEARYTFCYAVDGEGGVGSRGLTFTRSNSTPIASKEFLHCYHHLDPDQCRESDDYVQANVHRNQLRNAMTESVMNPFAPTQTASRQTCEWEKLEGRMGAAARAQVNNWLSNGFTVGIDVPSRGMCMQVKEPLGNLPGVAADAPITLAAYRCR